MIVHPAMLRHLCALPLLLTALILTPVEAASELTLLLGPPSSGERSGPVVDGDAWEVPVGTGAVRVEVAAGAIGARSFVVELDGTPVGTFSGVVAGSIEVPVRAGSDDAEEFLTASASDPDGWPAGFSYMTSSDLELGHDPPHASQLVGVRFTDLGLPAGARIIAADVVFTADGRSDDDLVLTIWGERSPRAETFAQDPGGVGTRDLSGRHRTPTSVSWRIDEPWRTRTPYTTPDLSAIVQEVVDLDGWGRDSSLVLLFEAAEPGTAFRRAISFDGSRGDPDVVPRLRLDYEATVDAATINIDVPAGTSELTVTAYGAPNGQGDPVAAATVTLVRSTEAALAPAPEHVPSEPEPTEPEPTEPEPTEPEPTEPTEPEPIEPTQPTEPEPTEPTQPEPAEPTQLEPAEPTQPEPTEPAPTLPTVLQPSVPSPVTATPPPASATRVDRLPIRAARTGIVLGDVDVTSFDDGTSAITLRWRRDRLMTFFGWLHPGTCAAPAPAMMLLRPLAPNEEASETRAPLPGSSLRLGGYVIVVRDEAGAIVGCVDLAP